MSTNGLSRRAWCALAALAIAAAAWLPMSAARAGEDVIHQLRVYEIFDGTKAVFHDRFRDHAARIMRRHGFDIVAIWETRRDGRPAFVYLLEWPDKATMRSAWEAFMADEEWARIKRETRVDGPIVGDIEDLTLHLTDYSPARWLSRGD